MTLLAACERLSGEPHIDAEFVAPWDFDPCEKCASLHTATVLFVWPPRCGLPACRDWTCMRCALPFLVDHVRPDVADDGQILVRIGRPERELVAA